MKRTPVRRWVCAALLLGLALGTNSLAEDWLTNTADPKPPRFRAARYDGETPSAEVPNASSLRMDDQPEVVPAPQTVPAVPGNSPAMMDNVDDLLDWDEFIGECPFLFGDRSGQIVVGAEYLYARPTFSEATAYAQIDDFTTNSRQTLVQYDFGYESTPRVYMAYRRPDCDTELRFTYTQLKGDAAIASGPTDGDQVFILDPFTAVCSCTEIVASAAVDLNTYDIDFAKRQCISPPCVDPCNATCQRPCQSWDITYWFGLRIADVSWRAGGQVIDTASQDLVAINEHAMNFSGVGPRAGANLRRYFGRTGRLSLYGRANIALLLGQYEITSSYYDAVDDDTDTNMMERERVIPVTEIEVGLSYNIRQRTTVSAGYFLQAWHDLGMSQVITGQFPQGYDDANILSFDGMFVRGEWSF